MKLSSPRRPGLMILAGFLAVAFVATAALAAVLLNESFSYADGPLVGQGGWTSHSGAGAKPIQVTSGRVRVEQSAGSGEDDNVTFPVQATTATTRARFTLNVPSVAPGGGAPTFGAGDYFAHLRPATLVNNFRARVYTIAPVAGGNYSLGLSTTSAGTSPIVPMTVDLNFNQDYSVVISYNAATGTSTMSVDGIAGQVVSASAAAVGEDISGFALRQSAVATTYQIVDDVVVGQTREDLGPSTLPGMAPVGAVALASLLLGAGALITFRRARMA